MSAKVNRRGSPLASTSDIMLVQETMKVAGLYRGEIDGLPGIQTLSAVRAYKKRQGMPVDNTLDDGFIMHLRYET